MMSGKAATGEEFCAFIEQVTADDLVRTLPALRPAANFTFHGERPQAYAQAQSSQQKSRPIGDHGSSVGLVNFRRAELPIFARNGGCIAAVISRHALNCMLANFRQKMPTFSKILS